MLSAGQVSARIMWLCLQQHEPSSRRSLQRFQQHRERRRLVHRTAKLKVRGWRSSPAYIRFWHRGLAAGVMVWKTVIWTHIGTFMTSYILWFCPDFEACQTPSSNTITQDHMLHDVFGPSSIHIIFYCCLKVARSPDLSPTENTRSWITERLARHPSPVNMVDDEEPLNEFPFLSFKLSLTSCTVMQGLF